MRGEWVVLPTSLIDSAVERAHQGDHLGRKQFEASNLNTFLVSNSGRSSKNKGCIMQTMSTLYQQNKKRTLIYATGTIKCMGHSRTRPFWSTSNREICSDILTRYQAGKIVPSTSSFKVIPALNDIYINYG